MTTIVNGQAGSPQEGEDRAVQLFYVLFAAQCS